MWIHDIFLDDYFPGREPTLALDELQPGLNLLLCGSTREAHELQRQIVDLLTNNPASPPSHTLGSGTIGLRGGECLLEISRIAVPGSRGKPQLRAPRDVVIAAGNPTLAQALIERIDQVDARAWRALYTDTDGPLQRLSDWWELGLHDLLAAWPAWDTHPPRVSEPTTVMSLAPAAPPPPEPSPVAPPIPPHSPPRTNWQHYHARLLQRTQGLAAAASHSVPPVVAPASSVATSSTSSAPCRNDYLAAKQRVTHLSQQQLSLQRDLESLRREIDLAESAHRLLADWQLAHSAQRLAAPEHGAEATPDELRLLEKVDRQINQLRRQLQQCRQGIVTKTREAEQQQLARCQESLVTAREIIREYDDLSATGLTYHTTDQHDDGDELPWDLKRLIPRIRELSHARRAARQAILASIATPETASNGSNADPSTAAPTPPEELTRRESLLRQVEQLRAETRRLLARQAISAQALLGVGMLFSSSVAVFLAALLLPLDGAELATGAIGLIGMVASALLKASFERTPSHRLRQQRLRINALLEEIQQLPASTWSASSDRSTEQSVTAPDVPTCDLERDQIDTQSASRVIAWEDADAAWQEFLQDLGTSADTSPREVIRAMREHNLHCRQERSRAAATAHQALEQQFADWVARAEAWCQQHEIALHDLSSPSAIHTQIAAALDHLLAGRTATGDDRFTTAPTATPSARQETLQQQLRQAKRRRQRILERHCVEDSKELQQLLGVWDLHRQQLARVEEARANVAQVLDHHPQSAALQQLLETSESLPRFLERAAVRQQELRRTLNDLGSELDLCKATLASTTKLRFCVDRLGAPNDSSAINFADAQLLTRLILWQLESHEQQAMAEIERASREKAAESLRQLAEETAKKSCAAPLVATPATERTTDISVAQETRRAIPLRPLLRATAWLRTITGDKHLQFQWEGSDPIPKLLLADEPARSLRDLPARWQQVAVLSLQMALAKEHAVRHGALPWLFTDRSLRVPQRAAEQLALRLLELAADDQQIVLLVTRRETSALFDKESTPSFAIAPLVHPTIPFAADSSSETPTIELPPRELDVPNVEHSVDYTPFIGTDPYIDSLAAHEWAGAWRDESLIDTPPTPITMVEVAYERAG